MPLNCYACEHPKVVELDLKLCQGVNAKKLAAEFDLDPGTVRNHAQKHLSVKLQELIKERRIKPLVDYLNMMRTRGETTFRQVIPCQELDGVDDPSAEPVPKIDFSVTPLTEIANFFKSQIMLNELLGRVTGEIRDESQPANNSVKLTISLPAKVEPGERPSEYLGYRYAREELTDKQTNERTNERLIEGVCTSIQANEQPPTFQQLTLDLD